MNHPQPKEPIAGVTTFSALLFAVNTVDEFIESMHFFAEAVIQKLK
jgi:hypothetical protein